MPNPIETHPLVRKGIRMKNTIGARIAEQRKQKGMTQETLAEALGVSAQAVSKWENDVSCPDISLLPALAEKLEISLDELLGGKKAEERVRIAPAPQRSVEELNLMIRVQSADGDRVRVCLPLVLFKALLVGGGSFIKCGGKDVGSFDVDWEQIFRLAESGVIGKIAEVESADGDTVEVVVE